MKKLGIGLLFVVLVIFTGCIKQPEVPKYTINQVDKIGYIIEESGDVYHAHMGTTIFNNLEKDYAYNWQLEKEIDSLMKENVKRELINLKEKGISFSDVDKLIVAEDGKWVIKNKEAYTKLKNGLGLKAVLVIHQTGTYVQTGRDPILMKRSGLASHNLFGLKRYFAVSAYDNDLYLLNPVAIVRQPDVERASVIYDTVMSSFQERSGFEKPKDIENITKDELVKVREKIVDLLDSLTLDIDSFLVD